MENTMRLVLKKTMIILHSTLTIGYLSSCYENTILCTFHFRLCLSVLHYNENADRLQRVTTDSRPRYSLQFPKAKAEMKTKLTYGVLKKCMLLRQSLVPFYYNNK